MYVKKNLMLWAAAVVLAMPLVLAGSAFATGIDGGYVGTDTCLSCHKPGGPASDKTSFKKAGHPYKFRATKGLTPVFSGGDDMTTITDPLSAIQLNNTPLCSDINALTLGDGCKDWPSLGDNPTSYFVANSGTGKLDWSGVQYVIGGFHAKFRWAMKDTHNLCSGPTATPADCKTGYIVTGNTQYNMESALPGNMLSDWSGYNSNADKGYDCAICHNTNGIAKNNSWNDSGSNTFGNRSQPWTNMGWGSLLTVGTNTLTNAGGFKSEWTLDGVQCEACHGKGSNGTNNGHADGAGTQNVLAIVSSEAAALTTTSIPAAAGSYTAALSGNIEICAMCHIRGSNTAGGKEWGAASLNRTLRNGAEMQGNVSAENRAFIKHHEQYNEMVGLSVNPADTNPANGDGVHASLNCTSCHDPHQRASQVVPAVADAMGITDNNLTAQQRGVIVSCESCHGAMSLKWGMGNISCVDCHMGEAVRSAPSAGMMGAWGKQADVKSHIFKISTTDTDIIRSANTITDGAGVLIPVAIAKNALTVDYACGKCHDSTLAASQGTQGLASGVTTSFATRAGAQVFAKNMHNSKPAPLASFFANADAVTNFKINFNASTSICPTGTSCAYAWSTGETGQTASHTFADATPVSVTLTVTATGAYASSLTTTRPFTTTHASTQTVTPSGVNAKPVAAHGAVTVNAYTVSFADATTDAAAIPTGAISVNWGDGTVETGNQNQVFSHTYPSRSRTYTIVHTAMNAGGMSAGEHFTVSVPTKYTVSGAISTGAGTRLYLKKNGHTVKAITATGGTYTFTNVVPGTYTITAYKRGSRFSRPAVTLFSVTNANVTDKDINAL